MSCVKRNLATPCILLVGVTFFMFVTWMNEKVRRAPVLNRAFQLPTFSGCASKTLNRLVNLPLTVNLRANVDVTSFEITGCFEVDSEKLGLYRIVHEGNFGHTICKPTNKKFFPSNQHEEPTALASLAGSGNTWTRHLFEELTGIYTGSLYGSTRISDVFQGENTTNNVIAVKTHSLLGNNKGKVNFTRAIIVIRDLFDANLAEYNRRKLRNKTGLISQVQFDEVAFRNRMSMILKRQDNSVAAWIRMFEGDIFVLYYEKLKTDLLNSLTKMAAFCNSVVTLEKLWCIVQNQEGSFHRGEKPKWMSRENLLDNDMEILVSDWMEDIKSAIRKGNIATN